MALQRRYTKSGYCWDCNSDVALEFTPPMLFISYAHVMVSQRQLGYIL